MSTSASGVISILDACFGCTLTPSFSIDIVVQYHMMGVWYFPVLTVEPEECESQVVYSCEYLVGGPYTGTLNMCGFSLTSNTDICMASFDPVTGTYMFDCDDMYTFPSGEYQFKITATLNDVSTYIIFTMTLVEECEANVTPAILNDPFGGNAYTYKLRNNALKLPYNLADIGVEF
jgi:hypothetical protein